MRIRWRIILLSAALEVTFVTSSQAQSPYLGTVANCTKSGCHAEQKKWSEQEEQPQTRHKDAYDQLTRDLEKSKKYAKSIDLTDPQTPTGRCVECHAPRAQRLFKEGVSCEVCHEPGRRYETIHDDQPYMTVGYVKAQQAGMPAFINNPKAWVPRCVSCHVIAEQKLIEAGHPSGTEKGKEFDVSVKYKIVSSPNGNHWKTKYDGRLAEIRTIDQQARAAILRLRNTNVPPPPPVTTSVLPPPSITTSVLPPTTTIPVTTSIRESAGGTSTLTGGGPPNPPSLRPTTTFLSTTTIPFTTTMAPTTSIPRTPSGNGGIGGGGRGTGSSPPSSIVTSSVPSTTTTIDPVAAPPTPMGLLRSPAALVAAVQGRAIDLLNSLLMRNEVVPARVRPDLKIQYSGPDAELLQLQREVIALALEALGTAPAQAPPPTP